VSVLRNVISDLVARRLWPVAVVLALALVAVPVLLGRVPAPAPTPATPVAQTTSAPVSSRAAVTVQATETRRDIGSVRNPFKGPASAMAAATTSTSTSTGTPSSSGSGSTSSGDGSTTSGGGTSTGGTTTTTTPKKSTTPTTPDPIDTYRLTLRFGQAGALKVRKDVARLTPLPSLDQPFFVFMGVLTDGKTAVFLISSDVTANGDGTCKPSPTDCQTIELQEGETEYFDLTVDGQPVQYQLDIIHLRKNAGQTATAAAASARRHSDAGARLLRGAHIAHASSFDGMALYRWLPASGLLDRVPEKAQASGVTSKSAEAEVPLVGAPVWHFKLAK
jgi:hypothetical protein